jgi:hypothetical protein
MSRRTGPWGHELSARCSSTGEVRAVHAAARAAMTKTAPRSRRIELLLNTLVGERYARRSLLAELVEELATETDGSEAVRAGRALLERLDAGMDEVEFDGCVEELIAMTRTISGEPAAPNYSAPASLEEPAASLARLPVSN